MEKNTFDVLKDFIIQLDYIDSKKITEDTKIEEDLGITGDDAVEFLEEFSSVFHVDVSNFDFNKYFHSEGLDLKGILKWAFGLSEENPYVREKLTLKDLADAIDKGVLE